MDTAWIPIFILTFAECVAPAGKTVCQEQEFQLQFLTAQRRACSRLRDAKDGGCVSSMPVSWLIPTTVGTRSTAVFTVRITCTALSGGWR